MKNPRIIIGLLVVIALAVAGSWVLVNSPSPASPQPQTTQQDQSNGPTPPTPDFAGFETSFCCDSGTPKILTPSQGQIDLWTQVAKTQQARYIQQQSVTEVPPPTIEYIAPTDESKTYTDPNYGYSFQYPANWYATPMDSVAVTNYPLNIPIKGFDVDPDSLRIDIYSQNVMEKNTSFDKYLSDNFVCCNSKILSVQNGDILENGLQTYKVRVQGGTGEYSYMYVTNGDKVFVAIVKAGKTYSSVQERIITSFKIN
jgi:hypothetical protein